MSRTLGQRLHAVREALGLDRHPSTGLVLFAEMIALVSGLEARSPSQIRAWERDELRPSAEELVAISLLAEEHPAVLIFGESLNEIYSRALMARTILLRSEPGHDLTA